MQALYIFQIATPILTYKHQKLIHVYFLQANQAMCRNRQNAENEHQQTHKKQVH